MEAGRKFLYELDFNSETSIATINVIHADGTSKSTICYIELKRSLFADLRINLTTGEAYLHKLE